MDALYSIVESIEHKTQLLKAEIRKCSLIHASVGLLPIAELTDDGHDTIHDEIESIEIKRLYGQQALDAYFKSIDFQYKDQNLSNKAARRAAGVIHVWGGEALKKSISTLLLEINDLKKDLLLKLTALDLDWYNRQRFFNTARSGVMPKTVTRLLHYAEGQTTSVSFSWLRAGTTTKQLDHDQSVELAKFFNKKAAEQNANLNESQLNEKDANRLAPYQDETFIWIRPARLNPRFQVSYRDESGIVQLPPYRATTPLLICQSEPLKKYNELADFRGYHALGKIKGREKKQRTPAIEAIGLYLRDADN